MSLRFAPALLLLTAAAPAQVAELHRRVDTVVEQLERGEFAAARAQLDDLLTDALQLAGNRDALPLWARLGQIAVRARDMKAARRAWQAVVSTLEPEVDESDRRLHDAWANLAFTLREIGELDDALRIGRRLYEIRSATLADDDPLLLATRLNLASTIEELGDLDTAASLCESVYIARLASLPDEHPDLQRTRNNLAVIRSKLGDTDGAYELFTEVYEVFARTLPDEHPDLQTAMGNLASTMKSLGDLEDAARLERELLEIRIRTLPEDHRDLNLTRLNHAVTRLWLGDAEAALAINQKVVEVFERTLPTDHHELLLARENLATTMRAVGDNAGALALFEQVYAARTRTLPADHPELQRTRIRLAAALSAAGDDSRALELQRQAVQALAGRLPAEHPDLLRTRGALAITLRRLGRSEEAVEIERDRLSKLLQSEPDGSPAVLAARENLAVTLVERGDLEAGIAMARTVLERRVATLAPGHPLVRAAQRNLLWMHYRGGDDDAARALSRQWLGGRRDALRDLALSPRQLGTLAATWLAALDAGLTLGSDPDELLLTAETIRGLATRSVRRTRALLASPRAAEARSLMRRIAMSSRTIAGLAQRDARDARRQASLDKERLEAELATLTRDLIGSDSTDSGIRELAAQLPEDAAAVSFIAYSHHARHPSGDRRRLVALCFGRDAEVRRVDIGDVEQIEALVDTVRRDARSDPRVALEAIAELGKLVMQPVLDALGDVKTVLISSDDTLGLVPLDALPINESRRIIVPVVSLFDLLDRARGDSASGEPRLLAIGGADQPGAGPFHPLPATAREIVRLQRLFDEVFPNGDTTLLHGTDVAKSRLLEETPGARFVHIATHGYFAGSERQVTFEDSADPDPIDREVVDLSPLALSGLALAGANLQPDDFGEAPGLVTAEELLAIDLSSCELCVLSACDTSQGVRRAGRGYASLRAALQAAGARHVLTTLWEIDDTHAQSLIVDFYRRIWRDGVSPHAALRAAKALARERGMPFADWAGWVLTGL